MVRSLRRDQQAILGGSTADVVDFAVSLQGRIDDLHRAVDEVAAGLTRVDRRVDGAVTNTSVVRYDAYGDAGGQQSASFAFLDSTPQRHGRDGDPGPRLCAGVRQGARAGTPEPRPLPRGGRGRRTRDGALGGIAAARAGLRRCYIRAVSHVLVLNASYEPLNVCSTRRAHVLVWKGKAEVVERLDEPLRTATNTYTRPHVIRLVTYVRVPRSVKRRISRRALFARDGWRCVYCGDSAGRLTLDHVVPRSRGGDSVWENVVTACAPCNLRKGDRLLEETHMNLARPPRAPVARALHQPCAPPRAGRVAALPPGGRDGCRGGVAPDGHAATVSQPSSRSAR